MENRGPYYLIACIDGEWVEEERGYDLALLESIADALLVPAVVVGW